MKWAGKAKKILETLFLFSVEGDMFTAETMWEWHDRIHFQNEHTIKMTGRTYSVQLNFVFSPNFDSSNPLSLSYTKETWLIGNLKMNHRFSFFKNNYFRDIYSGEVKGMCCWDALCLLGYLATILASSNHSPHTYVDKTNPQWSKAPWKHMQHEDKERLLSYGNCLQLCIYYYECKPGRK